VKFTDTLKEIAYHLQIHYTAVSKVLKSLRKKDVSRPYLIWLRADFDMKGVL